MRLGRFLLNPPYSPYLAMTDFHLFRSIEHFIGGKTFRNKEVENSLLNIFFRENAKFF